MRGGAAKEALGRRGNELMVTVSPRHARLAMCMQQLVALSRPRGALYVILLPLVGYGYAHWEQHIAARSVTNIARVVLAWLFLHVGTMWLNAALDHDEAAVLYGTPTPVPHVTGAFGYLALAGCVFIVLPAGMPTVLCAAAAVVLSIAYSHPCLAWKGHPWLGPLINVLGYGVLSPLAGLSVVGSPATARAATLLLLFCCFMLSLYFVAQCFQSEEDAARGYRTRVVTHGPRATVRAARNSWWLGASGVATLSLVGWIPRVCLFAALVVPPLMRRSPEPSPTMQHAMHSARWALGYGVVLLTLAWGDHLFGARRMGTATYASAPIQLRQPALNGP